MFAACLNLCGSGLQREEKRKREGVEGTGNEETMDANFIIIR